MSERRRVLVEQSEGRAVEVAAELVSGIACEAMSRSGQFTMALAGGTTPRRLYAYLASSQQAEKITWSMMHVFFGDERDVPHDHPESNYRMAQQTLLEYVPLPFEQVHPMAADAADLDAAAEDYERQVRRLVPAGPDGVPALDLILLGMGGDGHTASLFPGTPALQEEERLVVSQFVPVLGRHRMTFTLPLLNAARNVLFLVTGQDKAQALHLLLSGDAEAALRLPAGRVLPRHGELLFVLDAAAAALTRHRLGEIGRL